jgi:HD-like signal output (HDOD) protein/CheY-like chemotaxis protein
VDDESKILDGIRRMLHSERARWDVYFANSGAAALDLCEKAGFDIVISDMRMPEMDGATLLTQIRDRFPSTSRVILSGHADLSLTTRTIQVAHRFLTKPCAKPELVAALERICALQDLFCGDEMHKIVGAIGELPSFSKTYHCLREILQDPNTSLSAVADVISKDVAMSAKILQLVNSSFFGLAQNIVNLQDAVAHIGIQTISNLALATETFTIFHPSSRVPESVCESVQRHSCRVAAIASCLPSDRKQREITVISALLHDVGTLILANQMPEAFCSVLERMDESRCRSFQAEEQLMGISHAEIGAYLLGLWNIPTLAVEAVAFHHHPLRVPHTSFDSCLAVYVADLLAHELDEHPNDASGEKLSAEDRACLESVGLANRFAEFRQMASAEAF